MSRIENITGRADASHLVALFDDNSIKLLIFHKKHILASLHVRSMDQPYRGNSDEIFIEEQKLYQIMTSYCSGGLAVFCSLY